MYNVVVTPSCALLVTVHMTNDPSANCRHPVPNVTVAPKWLVVNKKVIPVKVLSQDVS